MIDLVQVERLDQSPRPGMDEHDLYRRHRMAFIPRIFALYPFKHLAQTMHDLSLFFRMRATSEDKDFPFTGT